MKKVVIFLLIVIGLFAIIGTITKMQQNKQTEGNIYGKSSLDPATIDLLDDPLYQNIVLPEELNEMLANKEDVTVYFFSPTCHFCMETTPIISPVAEQMGINLLQFNLLEFKEGWQTYNIESTPTLVHYKNGKETGRIVGAHPREDYEQFFSQLVK